MSFKIWIINIVLAVVAAYLGLNAAREWSREAAPVAQEPVSAQEQTKAAPQKTAPAAPAGAMPRREAFNVIVEKNLFAGEREEIKEEPKPTAAPQQAKPAQPEPEPLKVSFTLYGVIAAGNLKRALLASSVDNAPGGNERRRDRQAKPQGPQWYEVGEGEEGWKVTSIEKDRIVVQVGNNKTEVLLYDKERPRQRAPAAVVSKGPTVVTVAAQAAAVQPAVVGEKGAGMGSDTGQVEAGTRERVASEEKKVVPSTSRTSGSISSRGSGDSSLRKDGLGGSRAASSYPPSRLPPFIRQK